VSCEQGTVLLHAYLDGELDAARAAEFERHLGGCVDCAGALDAQKTLRSALARADLYARTPAALRQRVAAQVSARPERAAEHTMPAWRWLAVAAAFLLIVFTAWRLLPRGAEFGGDSMLTAQIFDAHLRSLQPGHLTDVTSSDQHTVKPWFDGRLDFAPPVRDFSNEGFPLVGGRLDVIGGRTVAALVYGRRKHFINVFLWPHEASVSREQAGSRQGYNWIRWRSGGFEVWAVSDAAPADLQELRRLFER